MLKVLRNGPLDGQPIAVYVETGPLPPRLTVPEHYGTTALPGPEWRLDGGGPSLSQHEYALAEGEYYYVGRAGRI